MLLETDGQAFGPASEAPELVEGALVGGDLRRQPVVLVADVVVKRFAAAFDVANWIVDSSGSLFFTEQSSTNAIA